MGTKPCGKARLNPPSESVQVVATVVLVPVSMSDTVAALAMSPMLAWTWRGGPKSTRPAIGGVVTVALAGGPDVWPTGCQPGSGKEQPASKAVAASAARKHPPPLTQFSFHGVRSASITIANILIKGFLWALETESAREPSSSCDRSACRGLAPHLQLAHVPQVRLLSSSGPRSRSSGASHAVSGRPGRRTP